MATESVSPHKELEIFRELEEYRWDKDREFQGGLQAILGPNPSPSQKHELTLRAQCFYFSRKKGVSIDFDAYKNYLSQNSNQYPSLSSRPENASPSSVSSPATQQQVNNTMSNSNFMTGANETHTNAPSNLMTTVNLTHTDPPTSSSLTDDPTNCTKQNGSSSSFMAGANETHTDTPSSLAATPTTTSSQSAGSKQEAPYPATFYEIVKLIQSGAPIPGIVDIPPIVLHGQGSKPSMRARRKPWEMHKTEDEVQWGRGGTFGDHRDIVIKQELPDEQPRDETAKGESK